MSGFRACACLQDGCVLVLVFVYSCILEVTVQYENFMICCNKVCSDNSKDTGVEYAKYKIVCDLMFTGGKMKLKSLIKL